MFGASACSSGPTKTDPAFKRIVSALTQALADLGWTVGRNVLMDLRWGGGDVNRIRAAAQELVGLQPSRHTRRYAGGPALPDPDPPGWARSSRFAADHGGFTRHEARFCPRG